MICCSGAHLSCQLAAAASGVRESGLVFMHVWICRSIPYRVWALAGGDKGSVVEVDGHGFGMQGL